MISDSIGALVEHRRVDAVAEVVEVGERTALFPRRDDVHHHALTDVADRRQPEAHRLAVGPIAHREVGDRLVDVGDEHLDAELAALVEEDRGLVLVGLDLVSSAARYSTGWFALSYAVWYATKP